MKKLSQLKSYLIGFILSLLFTATSYLLVVNQIFSGGILITVILGLGILQLLVQLVFFLHLGQESKPRWHLIFFISTVFIILIVVVGSIWIMDNLNYNMVPQEINTYIMEKEMIYK
ncbi:MAG: cytochrome o ubiquinol oxidase subunit IV [Patescibacteria group bacterium]